MASRIWERILERPGQLRLGYSILWRGLRVLPIVIGLSSCVSGDSSQRIEELPNDLPRLDYAECSKINVSGRFANQGKDRRNSANAIDSRFVWIFNHAFKLDSRIEATVATVDIKQISPISIELVALNRDRQILASADLQAEKRHFACVAGKVIIARAFNVNTEGGGFNRVQIAFSKNVFGDLEVLYERRYESLHYLISPTKETIVGDFLFAAVRN